MLEHALAYASRGFPVFPLRRGGKEPIAKGGFHTATTDPQRIEHEWGATPDANIGVPGGRRSGRVFLDLDKKEGTDGFRDFERLSLAHGGNGLADLDGVPSFNTGTRPGAGKQYVFELNAADLPEGDHIPSVRGLVVDGVKYEGIDLRAEGGYSVVPPSRTDALYNWEDEVDLGDLPAAPIPRWLLDRLLRPISPTGNAPPPGTLSEKDALRVRRALRFVPGFDGYDEWIAVGGALHHADGGGTAGFRLWEEWSEQWPDYPGRAELEERWRTFGRHPTPRTVATLFKLARDNGWREAGASSKGGVQPDGDDHVERVARRARGDGLLAFETAEAYRRAVRAVGLPEAPSTAAVDAARDLAGVPGAEEDIVVRLLDGEGDGDAVQSAFREGRANGDAAEAPSAVGAGILFEWEGALLPMSWEVTRRKSADTGTLRTPRFSDRLSIENAARRHSAARRVASAEGWNETEELISALEGALLRFGELDADARTEVGSDEERGDAELVIEMIEDLDVELFHSPGGLDAECYATVPVGNHREVWPLGSRGFKRWVSHEMYQRHRERGNGNRGDARHVPPWVSCLSGGRFPFPFPGLS